MVPVVSKKYVKALLIDSDIDKANDYYSELNVLNDAYQTDKMKNIVLSPSVTKNDKYHFLLSLVDRKDKHFENFIKILVENDRIDLLPSICDELRYQISVRENRYVGNIISNEPVDQESISNIEEKLNKKFNSSIKLNSVVSDYPGIKIEIEDLGVEISFSIDRLKAQMTEHILKAI